MEESESQVSFWAGGVLSRRESGEGFSCGKEMTMNEEEEESTKNIRVVVRVRPLLGPERSQPARLLKVTDESCLMLQCPDQRVNVLKNFCFDGVLGDRASQV